MMCTAQLQPEDGNSRRRNLRVRVADAEVTFPTPTAHPTHTTDTSNHRGCKRERGGPNYARRADTTLLPGYRHLAVRLALVTACEQARGRWHGKWPRNGTAAVETPPPSDASDPFTTSILRPWSNGWFCLLEEFIAWAPVARRSLLWFI